MIPVPREEIIYGNKFCNDIDNPDVDFCHRSHVKSHNLTVDKVCPVLVSHNSDTRVTTEDEKAVFNSGTKRWYVTNKFERNNVFCRQIPLGIENPYPANAEWEGVGYERSIKKLDFLSDGDFIDVKPSEFIYGNFSPRTNPLLRLMVKRHFTERGYVNFESETLGVKDFYSRILDHEAVLCPEGNGVDTHRIWETLYLGRVAIVFNGILYANLLNDLPVVLYNCYMDKQEIEDKINEAKTKKTDSLMFSYWKDMINDFS
tara:strand:+ start:107 stop:883 length:777 start_codon:yes stop_codon:yes gene_type:complete